MECSTAHTYTSATSSYITFCDLHHFPTKPTMKRLCFYIIYMSHSIKPTSIKSYLSGICAELEPFYLMSTPSIHPNSSTTPLLGAPNCMAHLPKEKGLSQKVTYSLLSDQPHCASHNNLLFMVIILVGWHCLLHLGELVDLDSISLWDFRKSINWLSVKFIHWPPMPTCLLFPPYA